MRFSVYKLALLGNFVQMRRWPRLWPLLAVMAAIAGTVYVQHVCKAWYRAIYEPGCIATSNREDRKSIYGQYSWRDIFQFSDKENEKFTKGLTNITTIMTPTDCTRADSDQGIDVLIYINSAIENRKRRDFIRKTWGANINVIELVIKVVFVLGTLPSYNDYDVDTKREHEVHGDILQGDFIDNYMNLTYKGVLGLTYAANCSTARYILKVDDDVLVNIFRLKYHIDTYAPALTDKLQCFLYGGYDADVSRKPKAKWCMNRDEFLDTYYPDFCGGSAVLMTLTTAEKLITETWTTPFYWVDDVYVFGLLAYKANIGHVHMSVNFDGNVTYYQSLYNNSSSLIFANIQDDAIREQVWQWILLDVDRV
ncbi:beta-1,3-galactosyltransferase 1 [Lingula anatina]|uniref:Hexosyltransferase n=1 Tax=Lingula anatina TaxID=7574 RepID=A0A1S3I2B8_LINAN|nr:beta-1,3-galactosyltransferase 1 [Lingula anatina]|eukprot:XP_013392410.1 beta-1,3-galactosyltransferase 1 [Lingula anatina]